MSPIRRLLGIALQCALLAMSVVSGGYACELGTGHAAHMAMADMPMSDGSMPDMPGMPAHETSDTPSQHSDCSFPWSSGDCDAMTSCAPNALTADLATFAAGASPAHEDLVRRVDQLASVARAPEPPPPRA